MVDWTGVDLRGSGGVLQQGLFTLWPGGDVNDGHGGTGRAGWLVQQLPIGLLPGTPPQVDTEHKHALSGWVPDLRGYNRNIYSTKLIQNPLIRLNSKRGSPGACQVTIQISAQRARYTMVEDMHV